MITTITTIAIPAICKALCASGKFETGEGTCAPICLDRLGDARGGPHGCPHAEEVHGKLASAVLRAVRASNLTLTPALLRAMEAVRAGEVTNAFGARGNVFRGPAGIGEACYRKLQDMKLIEDAPGQVGVRFTQRLTAGGLAALSAWGR